MDLSKLTKNELLVKCEEVGITNCKSKNKSELIQLLNNKIQPLDKDEHQEDEDENDDEDEEDQDEDLDETETADNDEVSAVKVIKEMSNKFKKYNPSIVTKLNNINKAGAENSIPCTTKRVSQDSRIYMPYELVRSNHLTLEQLNTHVNGVCIGISPSKFRELTNNSHNNELDHYIINNIGSNNNVSAIVDIIKTPGFSGSSKEREEKKILDELIKVYNWKPIIKKTKQNKGNDKWEGHYYYNISGGEQTTFKSWEGKEAQIFTTSKGFMSSPKIINSVKACLFYPILFTYDIHKVFDNNDVIKYKLTLENFLKKNNYMGKSCYNSITELKCIDKNGILISPITYDKISIDDFGINHKLNISHNVAVSKKIILFCNENQVMLSDYRPGNLFWDFKIANMRQQDDTIEEYWNAVERSMELRRSS